MLVVEYGFEELFHWFNSFLVHSTLCIKFKPGPNISDLVFRTEGPEGKVFDVRIKWWVMSNGTFSLKF
jgi:hypothetical protein